MTSQALPMRGIGQGATTTTGSPGSTADTSEIDGY